jgi:hypothetical protein
MSDEAKGTKGKVVKDFEFLLTMVKTGSLTINYDAASTTLGWNKKKTMNKMSDFRMTPALLPSLCSAISSARAFLLQPCRSVRPTSQA